MTDQYLCEATGSAAGAAAVATGAASRDQAAADAAVPPLTGAAAAADRPNMIQDYLAKSFYEQAVPWQLLPLAEPLMVTAGWISRGLPTELSTVFLRHVLQPMRPPPPALLLPTELPIEPPQQPMLLPRQPPLQPSHPLFSMQPPAPGMLVQLQADDGPQPKQLPTDGPQPMQLPTHGPYGPQPMQLPTCGPQPMQLPTHDPQRMQLPTHEPQQMQLPTHEPQRMQQPTHESQRMQLPTHESQRMQLPTNEPQRMQQPTHEPRPLWQAPHGFQPMQQQHGPQPMELLVPTIKRRAMQLPTQEPQPLPTHDGLQPTSSGAGPPPRRIAPRFPARATKRPLEELAEQQAAFEALFADQLQHEQAADLPLQGKYPAKAIPPRMVGLPAKQPPQLALQTKHPPLQPPALQPPPMQPSALLPPWRMPNLLPTPPPFPPQLLPTPPPFPPPCIAVSGAPSGSGALSSSGPPSVAGCCGAAAGSSGDAAVCADYGEEEGWGCADDGEEQGLGSDDWPAQRVVPHDFGERECRADGCKVAGTILCPWRMCQTHCLDPFVCMRHNSSYVQPKKTDKPKKRGKVSHAKWLERHG